MKKLNITIVILLLALVSANALAAPPQTMNYQGVLKSIAGVPFTGTKKLTFKIYDAVSGGNLLWNEIQPTVSVAKGQFSVTLGAGSPAVPLSLAFDKPYWLGVTVDAEAEMTPRQPLTTAPYAFRARTADTVPGVALVDGTVTAAKLDTAYVKKTGDDITGNLTVSGNVGVGTTTPTQKLHVWGNYLLVEGGAGEKAYFGGDGIGNDLQIGSLNATVSDIVMYNMSSRQFMSVYLKDVKFSDGSAQTRAKTDCMGRYEDNGNGTVTDCRTGLIWLKNANCAKGVMSWDNAVTWATNLANGECSLSDGSSEGDWRLPTKSEWMAMVASARKQGFISPAITNGAGTAVWAQGDLFDNIIEIGYYLSSSTHIYLSDTTWFVYMANGIVYYNSKGSSSGYVWPVRAGL